ncbi:unnamed protein product [Plutella xylostella]|uniref:RNA-directed DNA polymerase n=1 Tax=Plutella xylostella TaxID=51655 RepID=A0A8S4D3B2_PLUXY|nr:unnamed protein product [Plutella xylostella]
MEHARPPGELAVEGGPVARADAWRKWRKQFEVFLIASGVSKESEEIQASLLVNLIGPSGYEIFSTFTYLKSESEHNLKCILTKFDAHFGTKPNITMSRFKFFSRNQEQGETIDQFVTALRLLSQNCDFGDLTDSLIKDRIVCGIASNTVRDRLLRTDDLSLAKAVQVCEAAELSKEESRCIEGTSSEARVDAVNSRTEREGRGGWRGRRGGGARRGGRRWAAPRDACASCGYYRCAGGDKCPAHSASCYVCDKKGHFAKMCVHSGQKVMNLSVEDDSSDELFYVNTIEDNKNNNNKEWIEIFVCNDESVQPVVCSARKIPLGMRDKLLCELQRMTDLGVIRKVTHPTDWVNAIVLAPKKNGDIRLCLDPRPLNRAVRRAHYALPTVSELAARLRGAAWFSLLDARSGFWMIELDDASADLCTFSTPFGRFQFLRLPYGVNCASEVFHAKIRQYLEDLEGTESFIDDIIVWGRTKEEHDSRLEKLLERAREIGIKFNKEKCKFGLREVVFLGHIFDESGMRPDNTKIKAIVDMPYPTDRKALERFLGMVNYLSKFIQGYSSMVTVLRCLLKKDAVFIWEKQHSDAVDKIKAALCAAPVLALYSAEAPVVLQVDASAGALGAVLLQGGRPVEFASLTLTDTQTRYAQIEKEMLAIVFACERFHQYIYGRSDITVQSDHKPLEALFKKSLISVPARIQRMMLRIQCYTINVVYTPGKYMYIADTLSRAPTTDVMVDRGVSEEVEAQTCFMISSVPYSDSKLELIRRHTALDEDCKVLIEYIMKGWPSKIYIMNDKMRVFWSYRESLQYIDGLILKNNQIFIPVCLRDEMLSRVHEGHLGIDRCKQRARDVMFWPGMSRDVEGHVRACVTCAAHAPRPRREPARPHPVPDRPWLKLGSDIFEYRRKYYVILVDYFSNYVEVNELNSICSKAVINALKEQFGRHGIPIELVTDNGPAYSSAEFKKFLESWEVRHTTSSPHYPQSNGKSERAVQSVKNILKKCIDSGHDFHLSLLNFRTTPRDDMDSPAQILMGRRLHNRLPMSRKLMYESVDNSKNYQALMSHKKKSNSNYNKTARDLPTLKQGDRVVLAGDNIGRPVKVIAKSSEPRSYIVEDAVGRRYRRNRRHLVARQPAPAQPGPAVSCAAPQLITDKGALPSASASDTPTSIVTGPSLQEQYDALLQMYGEKEEQLTETRLDLQDVTQLYKQQLQLLGPPPGTS